jgi:ABC-type phosphate transport system substrate-binding protein
MKAKTLTSRSLPVVALVMAVIGLPAASVAAREYKVIVHPSNPVTSLSRQQLAEYFLKKTAAWPSGKSVAPVDLERSSPARAAFSRDALAKSVAQVAAYWQQQIFAGRAVPPPEKRSDAEIVAFVERNPGAIGYVAEGTDAGDAKVVAVE